jgi:hypothetical protein
VIEIKWKLLLISLKINNIYNFHRHSTIDIPASALFIVRWTALYEIKVR